MKVLITGAGGFLGQEVCRYLDKNEDYELHGLGRNSYDYLPSSVKQHVVDLCDSQKVDELFMAEKFDAIIHTAAKAGVWGKFEEYFSINFRGTSYLLNAALNVGSRYFVYTSTPSVVFDSESISGGDETLPYPDRFLTAYAQTKSLAEQEVLSIPKEKMQTLSLRPHLIYGPGDPHILPRLIERNREGKLRVVGNGKNKVDVTHVMVAAKAHANALKSMINNKSLSNEAYFIADAEPVELWPFINELLSEVGERPVTKKIPERLCYGVGFLLESFYKILRLNGEPPMTRFVSLQLAKDHYFSHEKAKRDFIL